jgi:hypothetical protein
MYDMTIGWWHITIIAEVTEPVKVKKKILITWNLHPLADLLKQQFSVF